MFGHMHEIEVCFVVVFRTQQLEQCIQETHLLDRQHTREGGGKG